jgi:hypothetical protein
MPKLLSTILGEASRHGSHDSCRSHYAAPAKGTTASWYPYLCPHGRPPVPIEMGERLPRVTGLTSYPSGAHLILQSVEMVFHPALVEGVARHSQFSGENRLTPLFAVAFSYPRVLLRRPCGTAASASTEHTGLMFTVASMTR